MPKANPFIEIVPGVNFAELERRYNGAREVALMGMNEALRDAGRHLTPRIKDATPRGATNKLANNTVFQVLGRAEDMRMEIRQSAFSDKGFPYGVAVRTGTKPHFPPIDALVPWVIKKLHVPRDRARSVAFLVARKISKVGTKPNPYHLRVWSREQDAVMRILRSRVGRAIGTLHDFPGGMA